MSKMLAISAAFSVFAMAAFTLSATPAGDYRGLAMQTGAAANATAPAFYRPDLSEMAPVLSSLVG